MKEQEYKYNLNEEKNYEKAYVELFNSLGNLALEYNKKFHEECGQYVYDKMMEGVKEKKLVNEEKYQRACFLKTCYNVCLGMRQEVFNDLITLRHAMQDKKIEIRKLIRRRGKEDIWWLDIEGESDITKIESDEYDRFIFSINEDGTLTTEESFHLGKDEQ